MRKIEKDIFKRRRKSKIIFIIFFILLYSISSFISGFESGTSFLSIPSGILWLFKNFIPTSNSIKYLPSSVSKLTKLKELDIENTLIDVDSLRFINLENIEKISFDDRLLPYLIQNFHLLKKIDTINLTQSEYEINNPIFNSLQFNIEHENWMEDKDYKGHGCIVLKNSNKKIL